MATEELGPRAVGMTAVSPSLAPSEKEDAARIARGLGADHRFVESNELARDGYVQNGPDRCFHCKTELYAIARHKAEEWQFAAIVNGTNTDDLGDYRPGLEAARQAGVQSPLVEVGMSKADVRAAARLIGMDVWDKPAAACLSSRIPYGTSVTRQRLAQIGAFEAELKEQGFRQLRVRWHDSIARIEIDLGRAPALARARRARSHRRGRQASRLPLRHARPRRLPDGLAQRSAGRPLTASGLIARV